MAHFRFVVTLHPDYLFGLPFADVTVVEAEPGEMQITSPPVWTDLPGVIGNGTLSRYRREADQIRAGFSIGGVNLQLEDNVLTAELVASNFQGANAALEATLDRLTSFAATQLQTYVWYELRLAYEDDTPRRQPLTFPLQNVHIYNLARLKRILVESGAALDGLSPDPRLDRTLRYFSEGSRLYDLLGDASLTDLLSPLCFLQYWKAIASVLGDPSSSSDKDYQSRHRTYGLPKDYFILRVRPLHDIRNDFDVAHLVSLDAPSFVERSVVEDVRATAAEVIGAYVATSGA